MHAKVDTVQVGTKTRIRNLTLTAENVDEYGILEVILSTLTASEEKN